MNPLRFRRSPSPESENPKMSEVFVKPNSVDNNESHGWVHDPPGSHLLHAVDSNLVGNKQRYSSDAMWRQRVHVLVNVCLSSPLLAGSKGQP